MSVEKAIEVGEKYKAEREAEKEAKRLESMSAEQRQEEDAKAKAEQQAKENQSLLQKKDEELTEDERARKAQIQDAQKRHDEKARKEAIEQENVLLDKKDEELSDEEIARKQDILQKREKLKTEEWQRNVQQRIDEMSSESKVDKERIRKLEAELAEAKKAGAQEDNHDDELIKREEERVAKHMKEDAAKPREQRREMSDDELQEWIIEDMVAAQKWLMKQEYRRNREREADEASLRNTPDVNSDVTAQAEEVIKAQKESQERVLKKHPELAVDARQAELVRQGKTIAEAKKIIIAENPKLRIVSEILKEDDKYLILPNGPELLADEMEKRMNAGGGETQEERDARIAAEAAEYERNRLESIEEGTRSTRGRKVEPSMSDLEKQQFATYQKAFPQKTLEDFRKTMARRAKYAGT